MNTLYELFKVPENATQDEITKSYHKILQKADSLPQTEKIIEQVRRMKIAYGILSNPEKRKKYDIDLATKRADELLQNVQSQKEEIEEAKPSLEPEQEVEKVSEPSIDEVKIKQAIFNQINNMAETQNQVSKKQEILSQKQQRKQLKKQKREAKKQQQLKKEMEIQAYGRYLENQGYKVKYPWTWLRVKRLLITIITIIISFFILWQIPFIRKNLTDLYEGNFVIKFLVDTVLSIFNGIKDSIKSIFK